MNRTTGAKPATKETALYERLCGGPLDVYEATKLLKVAWVASVASRLRKRGHPVVSFRRGGVTFYALDWEAI